ncbi:hypothetical protein AXG93_3559s1010 [Marchantia polymorpha subsp. ruderalis]|uniref:AIG1-type G domain-containing protein n=1 Tax=Marchantia polymorpha subsp. ruderalis TaxID=1480154 RepID=A0A176WN24_MARPO|nr:hypothetical protein AXG93_3559s1010 [Marchantia polymorpha subsp. ruderalis]
MVLKREARSSSSRAEVQIEAQLQQMVKDQGRFDAKWGEGGGGAARATILGCRAEEEEEEEEEEVLELELEGGQGLGKVGSSRGRRQAPVSVRCHSYGDHPSARMDRPAAVSCPNPDGSACAAGKVEAGDFWGFSAAQSMESLTVLVLGKGGVGKSSTVNSLVGERVAVVSAFQSETLRPIQCSRSRAGFTLNIIDTPGLVEGGCVNDQALDIIRRFLLNKTIDAVLYVDRLDGYRVDNLDKQVIRAIARSFGPEIWRLGLVVLTHAQLSPPDGVEYSDFVARRSAALTAAIRQEAGFKKSEDPVPVVLVENSGRCNTNTDGEKILPDSTVWLPNLVEKIVEVATGPTKSLLIDKKLIEGPNANQRHKIWIPLLLLAQYFIILKPLQARINKDIEEEKYNRPQWEIRAEQFRRSSMLEEDRADEQAITDAFKQDNLDDIGDLGDQFDGLDDDDDDDL